MLCTQPYLRVAKACVERPGSREKVLSASCSSPRGSAGGGGGSVFLFCPRSCRGLFVHLSVPTRHSVCVLQAYDRAMAKVNRRVPLFCSWVGTPHLLHSPSPGKAARVFMTEGGRCAMRRQVTATTELPLSGTSAGRWPGASWGPRSEMTPPQRRWGTGQRRSICPYTVCMQVNSGSWCRGGGGAGRRQVRSRQPVPGPGCAVGLPCADIGRASTGAWWWSSAPWGSCGRRNTAHPTKSEGWSPGTPGWWDQPVGPPRGAGMGGPCRPLSAAVPGPAH